MQRFHSFPPLKAISQLTLLLVLAVQFLFLTSLPQVHQVAAQCTTVVTRREFRTLSGDERSRYFAAVRALKGPEGSTRPNQFDRFAQLHTSQAWPIHSRPQFLPWHRAFTRDWEQALQRASGDPTVFQPYFDFTIDSQNPPASPLWSDEWISGNGRQGDQCVVNSSGTMGSLTMYYIGTGQVSQHCLRRNFNFQPYAPLSAVQTVMAEQADFQRFATNVENALHPHVHLNTGGDASGMEAPNDLIFFFHHTFVDYIWSTWQAMNNGARFWDYGGTNFDNTQASLNSVLSGYPYTVGSVMPIANLCYGYAGSIGGGAARSGLEHSSLQTRDFKDASSPYDEAVMAAKATISDANKRSFEFTDLSAIGGAPVITTAGVPRDRDPIQRSSPVHTLSANSDGGNDGNKNNNVDMEGGVIEIFVPKLSLPLRRLMPMPEDYARMMGYNLEEVRKSEKRIDQHIINVNRLNGFKIVI